MLCGMPNYKQFEEYYNKHMPEIFGYVYLRIRQNRALTEDMVSEIFLKAVENFEQFDQKKGSFKAWIFQITKNYLIDYFRSSKNKNHSSLDEMENQLQDDHDTQKTAEQLLEKDIIKEAMNTLPEDKKELVALRYFAGYSFEEIAQMTNDNTNNVRVKMHRILQDLKRKLVQIK